MGYEHLKRHGPVTRALAPEGRRLTPSKPLSTARFEELHQALGGAIRSCFSRIRPLDVEGATKAFRPAILADMHNSQRTRPVRRDIPEILPPSMPPTPFQ